MRKSTPMFIIMSLFLILFWVLKFLYSVDEIDCDAIDIGAYRLLPTAKKADEAILLKKGIKIAVRLNAGEEIARAT